MGSTDHHTEHKPSLTAAQDLYVSLDNEGWAGRINAWLNVSGTARDLEELGLIHTFKFLKGSSGHFLEMLLGCSGILSPSLRLCCGLLSWVEYIPTYT